MSEKEHLIKQIKRILDQSPKADWTADMVLAKHELHIRQAFEYDPAMAPKSPSLGYVRGMLKILTELGDIKLTVNWEGSRRYNTYERIIPEPFILVPVHYRHRPWWFWSSITVGFALFGYISGSL